MLFYTFIETSYTTGLAIFKASGALCWLSLHPKASDPMKLKLEITQTLKPNQASDLFRLKEPFDLDKFPVNKIARIIEDPSEAEELGDKIELDYSLFSPNMSEITYDVWDYLKNKTQSGTTTTYGEIAQDLGVPKSSRAVARACASNKISILIPCHRVLTKEGGLSGYRWGVDFKKELLKREGVSLQETA